MSTVSRNTACRIFFSFLNAGGRAPRYSLQKLRLILRLYLVDTQEAGLNPKESLPRFIQGLRDAEIHGRRLDSDPEFKAPRSIVGSDAGRLADEILNIRMVLTQPREVVQLEMIFPPAGGPPYGPPAEAVPADDGVKLEELEIDIW